MIEQIKQDLLNDEGYRKHKYVDTLGVETIGIGFNLEEGFSKDECMLILGLRIENTISELSAKLPFLYDLPEDKIRVLVNMCYQLGINRFMKFKKLIKALEIRNYKIAAIEMLDSKWAGQTPLRANRLAKIMES